MTGHSHKCPDLKTRWDITESRCVPCKFKPGHEVAPNCGRDDEGGRHEAPFIPCADNTFNAGGEAVCRPCSSCPTASITFTPCNRTSDTQCHDSGGQVKASTVPTISTTPVSVLILNPVLWAVPLVIILSITLLVVSSALIIYRKRKRGQSTVLRYNGSLTYTKTGFTSLSAPSDDNDALENVLSPTILSAPLHTLLDNLDVLEELVILLDPESHLVKNTKHLASHCSFPSTWITYVYSMKDTKSPLKVVLEGICSRHPEWTVGHLAKLLRLMDRNDAITALTRLRPTQMDV